MIVGKRVPMLNATLGLLRERVPATLMIVVAALGLLQITALILLTLYRHFDWSYQADQKRVTVQQLQLEVKELRERVRLSSDPAYLEGLARKQGFIQDDERVIVPKQP
jgi:predicted signal transduction protein with EAL and GGDEF domain